MKKVEPPTAESMKKYSKQKFYAMSLTEQKKWLHKQNAPVVEKYKKELVELEQQLKEMSSSTSAAKRRKLESKISLTKRSIGVYSQYLLKGVTS